MKKTVHSETTRYCDHKYDLYKTQVDNINGTLTYSNSVYFCRCGTDEPKDIWICDSCYAEEEACLFSSNMGSYPPLWYKVNHMHDELHFFSKRCCGEYFSKEGKQ